MGRPGEVIYQKGNAVFIHSNGDVKKVAACKVKPYELKERKKESKGEKIEKPDWTKWIQESERSKSEEVIEEVKDEIGAKYLKMEKSVCFLESSVYVVEVPVREHGKAEVIEAKEKEIEN